MEWVLLLFVALAYGLFVRLVWRVDKIDQRVLAIEQRFQEVGINTAEQFKTDVVITEKWEDWDNIPDEDLPAHPSRRSEWVE